MAGNDELVTTLPLALVSSGEAWQGWEVPPGLEQLDIEAVDTDNNNAGIPIVVVVGKENPSKRASGTYGMKPVPADGVWQILGHHIPTWIWIKPSTTTTTVPVAELTIYKAPPTTCAQAKPCSGCSKAEPCADCGG